LKFLDFFEIRGKKNDPHLNIDIFDYGTVKC